VGKNLSCGPRAGVARHAGAAPTSKIDDAWLKAVSASAAQVHVTTNQMPMCSDGASARRIEVVKWEQYIPVRLRDPDMAQKIASDPNFLIWLAEGLRRYQAGER